MQKYGDVFEDLFYQVNTDNLNECAQGTKSVTINDQTIF